jgi:hypothetical protein
MTTVPHFFDTIVDRGNNDVSFHLLKRAFILLLFYMYLFQYYVSHIVSPHNDIYNNELVSSLLFLNNLLIYKFM